MFIRQLTYLVTLEREKHFGRAAQACNVSQPALSGAIRSIERELGMSIVQRSRRFEGFTPDGERVLSWARRVLADCEGLRQEASANERDPVGTLRFGAIPTTLPLVPLLTESCLQQFRQVRHTVYTMAATDILRQINNFELDLGLSYLQDERLKDFATIPMFIERYVLIARDHSMFEGRSAITWEEVAHLPLCLLTGNMQCRHGIDAAFAAAGMTVSPRVETDSMMALYSYVRCAGLYSIVPHSVLTLLEMRQELSALPLIPELQREIGLVMLDRLPLAPLLTAALGNFRKLDLQTRVDALLGC